MLAIMGIRVVQVSFKVQADYILISIHFLFKAKNNKILHVAHQEHFCVPFLKLHISLPMEISIALLSFFFLPEPHQGLPDNDN